jgi:Family of unknown function (DUF6113)
MPDPEPGPRVRRAAETVAAGAVGVVASLAGAIVHRHAVRPGDLLLPWGLLLALAAVFAVVVAAGRLLGGRGALGVAIGWAVVLLWLQQVRPEGDYLFAADFLGNVYVFGGMLTVAVAVVRGMAGSVTAAPGRREGPST